jgi:hypothetical protein
MIRRLRIEAAVANFKVLSLFLQKEFRKIVKRLRRALVDKQIAS